MRQIDNLLFKEYLSILNLSPKKPSLAALKELIFRHLTRIPFENISKIFYKKNYSLRNMPDFVLYLEGIRKYNFGGTCYANNYYFNLLLKSLGYNAALCGADMNNPDVHLVSIINFDKRDYLVDVGYAAPFFDPIPMDLHENYKIEFGSDSYIVFPKDYKGCSKLLFYRNDRLKHGYTVKQKPRVISEFKNVIEKSYSGTATFMNSVLLVRFGRNSSKVIHNYLFTEFKNKNYKRRILPNDEELIKEIKNNFHIREEVTREAIKEISGFNDAWN